MAQRKDLTFVKVRNKKYGYVKLLNGDFILVDGKKQVTIVKPILLLPKLKMPKLPEDAPHKFQALDDWNNQFASALIEYYFYDRL